MSDSLKQVQVETKQYGAVLIDDVPKPTKKRGKMTRKQFLIFMALAIALIICITLRFGFYNDTNTNMMGGHSAASLIPWCEKGMIGSSWNDNMVIFGGKAKGANNFLNYILYLDTKDSEWKQLFVDPSKSKSKQVHPGVLWKSAGVVTGNNFYVYGGSSSYHKSTEQSDMWKFDLLSKQWINLKVKQEANHPLVRAHCMATWRDRYIIMFGGKDHSGADRNWIWKYDITKPEAGFVEYKASGKAPPVRQAPGCGVIDDKFIVFGGRNTGGMNKLEATNEGKSFTYYNDLWTFDLGKAGWSEIEKNNDARNLPLEAAHLSLAVYGDKFVITGGHNGEKVLTQNWMYDFGSAKWKKLKDLPKDTERCSHAGVYVKESANDGVLVFGGQHNMPDQLDVGSVSRNDVLWYDFKQDTWSVVKKDDCNTGKAYWSKK